MLRSIVSPLLLVGVMSAIILADEPTDRFEERIFRGTEDQPLPYRLLTPLEEESDELYPLLLFFHGAGERGADNKKQLIHGMSDIASNEMRARHPCFVVAPQCPAEQQWVDTPWTADEHSMPETPTVPMRQSLDLVVALQEVLPIDPQRIYVSGLSMGGFGAWDAIQRRPELFAAGQIVCGGGDPAFAASVCHVPVWLFHGDDDTTVQPSRSRDMIAAVRAAGGAPIYTEYEGVGHNSWTATYANRAVWDWLFSQRRPATQ